MALDITYYIQRNYGEDQRYPVSKDAVMVVELMGYNKRVLTDWAIKILEENNATITEVLKPR